jgi:uncharacterized protein
MLAPSPTPCAHDQPYWDAAKQGRLLLQRCTKTGLFQFYPRGHSLATGQREIEWVESPGLGTVHTFTIVRRGFYENLTAPYALAIVEIDEGPRLTTHLIEVDPSQVTIGLRVKANFRPREEGAMPILAFRPC